MAAGGDIARIHENLPPAATTLVNMGRVTAGYAGAPARSDADVGSVRLVLVGVVLVALDVWLVSVVGYRRDWSGLVGIGCVLFVAWMTKQPVVAEATGRRTACALDSDNAVIERTCPDRDNDSLVLV